MDVLGLHFIRPFWLLLLPVAALAPVWWSYLQRPSGDWARVCDPHLLRWLGVSAEGGGRFKGFWVAVAGVLASVALAGPSLEKLPSASFSAQNARVVVLDLSRSMLAGDVRPDRLTLARFMLSDLLAQNDEGQLGLVTFGGDAYVVAPLTSDTRTIANLLPALRPDVIPVAGSRADRGLELGAELLTRAGLGGGQLLLVTDGVDRMALDAAERLADQGVRTSVLAVGTEDGAPIPSGNGFVSDSAGNVVIARMDRNMLRDVARAGGGRYTELTSVPDPDDLWPDADDLAFEQRDDALGERWKDLGPWLVLPLLPLVLVAFRRGLLFLLPLVMFTGMPTRAVAETLPAEDTAQTMAAEGSGLTERWASAWQRKDQQVYRALQDGDAERAALLANELAENPGLAGDAWYRAGAYVPATGAWAMLPEADAHYNRGNALAVQGQLDAAIAAYDRALELEPGMEDAQYNRDIIEQMKQQQEQQQQEQEQQEGEGESEEEQQGEQQQEQQQGEQQQESDQESEQQQSEQTEEQPLEEQLAQAWSEEDEQAMEQWLERIPDDPGGLLRRKFRYQHQRRGSPADEAQPW